MRPPKGEVTFAVHCSSAAYMPHFQDFLAAKLGRRNYDLIAIPGGVHALTLEEYLPKFSWAVWRQVKFLMDLDPPSSIVLIGHEDCRWYHSGPIQRFNESQRRKQETDLLKVRSMWIERFPTARVEMFYAYMSQGKAVFDAVR